MVLPSGDQDGLEIAGRTSGQGNGAAACAWHRKETASKGEGDGLAVPVRGLGSASRAGWRQQGPERSAQAGSGQKLER